MKRLSSALIAVPALALVLAACSPTELINRTVPASQPAAAAQAVTAQPAGLPTAASLPTTGPTAVTAPTSAPAANVTAAGGLEALFAQQRAFEDLYARVRPSVVQIVVTGGGDSAQNDVPAPFGELPGQPTPRSGGQGSGFIYDANGNIITNNHVVENAQTITVRFSDDTSAEAKLVGRDPYADLAVIKVDTLPQNALPLTLANADDFKVGQMTIALGNPFGLPGSMTTGIISGLERNLPGGATRYRLPGIIQTDAAINPGNSGGPLLNLNGEVIGVNTAIESTTGAFAGIGFAVPADQIQRVVPQLIANGVIEYAYLGVEMADLTPTLAKALGLPVERGALVNDVVADGPAARAGVRGGNGQTREIDGREVATGGDVITAVDGVPVTISEDVIRAILGREVGDAVQLTVLRDGQEQQISVTLAERPSN